MAQHPGGCYGAPMYDAMAELMRILAQGVATHEGMADSLAATAYRVDPEGRDPFIATFLSQVHLHRVEAMKSRARLDALVAQYGALHVEQS